MATMVVDKGKQIASGRMFGATPTQLEPKYIGWGTAAGTTATTDTTLFTEAAEARVAGTASQVTTTVTNDTYQNQGTLTSASGQTITNAGMFDASTVGNLFAKGDFTGLALNTGDSIQFTFKIKFA